VLLIHGDDDLLRWSDWIRAYRATAEFFDRKLAASDERHKLAVLSRSYYVTDD